MLLQGEKSLLYAGCKVRARINDCVGAPVGEVKQRNRLDVLLAVMFLGVQLDLDLRNE